MKLLHLRIASYLYNQITDNDISYSELFERYPSLNMNKEEHIKALIAWLRSWGCRQFKKDNEDLSINSIKKWFQTIETKFPSKHNYLIDYDLNTNKKIIIESFDNLLNKYASIHKYRNRKINVRIGPVGAAKALFAIRPNLFPPWDGFIYKKFKLEGNGYGYFKYLLKVKNELREIRNNIKDTELKWDDLFEYLGKKHTSYPKLIDEYYWITITQEIDPAKIENFMRDFYLNKYGQE
ncbi:MAG: hypothetical protein U9P73_00730 [Candidatus Cloacimonadota bacterium]|nr:hypothetical protein [Candidatus Cloacimonadota bacterium]